MGRATVVRIPLDQLRGESITLCEDYNLGAIAGLAT